MSENPPGKFLSKLIPELLLKAHLDGDKFALGASPEEASDRFIGIREQDQSATLIEIASDGLSLEQKSSLERYLLSELQAFQVGIKIYFKRRQSLAERVSVNSEASAPGKQAGSGPFGLKFRTRPIKDVNKIIAVSSGKGGVGKSTVSVNLAVGLAAQGLKVGLLDADLYGPSVPMMMGVQGPLEVSADQKMIPIEKYGVKLVSFGFMSDPYHPVIWRGPMVAKALEQLFYQTVWGEIDYLIIDLPPGTGDVQLTMIESLPLHAGIVVSTPQAVALLDAHKGLSMFEKLKVPVLGLVENMSHFQCSSCGHLDDIFGQAQIDAFAAERKIPIIGKIPLHRRIREAADMGVPVVSLDPQFGLFYMPIVQAVLEKG